MPINLKNLTIQTAHEGLKNGDFTATDLAKSALAEIESKNKELNAFLEVYDNVLVQAGFADKAIAEARKAGKDFPILCGIPLAIKDNILVKGQIASSASKILENYHATYDATVIKKLQVENGAVLVGRTNMDEFAMGGSTENSAFGPTRNPYDTARVAGGSSGGSAAAIAAGMVLGALGSDTGGSIRQPASFCGVVGLKPTYGAVSRYGVMAMGSSLDQIGPFAKTIEDAQIIFDAIKGKDSLDSTTIDETTYQKEKGKSKKEKLIIGVPWHFLKEGLHADVKKVLDDTLKKLEKKGYEIREISLPNISYSLAVYYVLMPAEVSSNMARFDGVKYGLHVDGKDMIEDYFKTRAAGFGPEVRRRILLGTYVLSSGYYDAYYYRANAVRKLITDDFKKAFESVDLILTPTAPSPAFKIGEKTNDPVAMYLEDIFTVTANLTGMPAVSVPAGMSGNLPIGMQLTAPHGGENSLFEAGKDIEKEV
ncbi:MAG: Asp-tRNA(Asn)/Glu-tRNA(Gln) amidotransferase subunit GatA [Patescibacteria group bacterium]|nr:Asp-tRNA(Asn)/Glu-tRNA(Gln) amidotransferase subunit GatA [Patescibacteria group bacterium]